MISLLSLSGSHQLHSVTTTLDPTCNTVGSLIGRICSTHHINVSPSSLDLYLLPSSSLWGGEPELGRTRLLGNSDDVTLLSQRTDHVFFLHDREDGHWERSTVCLQELSKLKPEDFKQQPLAIEDGVDQSRNGDFNSKQHDISNIGASERTGQYGAKKGPGCDLQAIVRQCSEVVSETEFEDEETSRGQSALPGLGSVSYHSESKMSEAKLNHGLTLGQSGVLVGSGSAWSSYHGDGLGMELSGMGTPGMEIPRLDLTTCPPALPPPSSENEVIISKEEIDLTIMEVRHLRPRVEQCKGGKKVIVISGSEDELPKRKNIRETSSRLGDYQQYRPSITNSTVSSSHTSDLVTGDIHLPGGEKPHNEVSSSIKEAKFPEGSPEVDSHSDEGIVMEESGSEDVMVVGVEGEEEVGVSNEQIVSVLRAEFQRSPLAVRWDVRRAMSKLRRVFGVTVESKQLLVETKLSELQREVRDGGAPVQPEPFHITCCGMQLFKEDLDTLLPYGWLNDQVINCYMKLLVESCSEQRVHIVSTFFYPKLVSSGYRGVERWIKDIDLFRLHLLLIPIHLGMHWCLAVVNFRRKRMEYFDSMGGRNRKCFKRLMVFLLRAAQGRSHCMQRQHWRKCHAKDIPRQHNTCDCGVFVCQFARWLCHYGCSRSKIPFHQKHIPMIRRAMIQEIKTRRLANYEFL